MSWPTLDQRGTEKIRLTSSDKEFIRQYVSEAKDESEKAARRKECAVSFWVSLPTIAALTAWTKIWTDKKSLKRIKVEVPKKIVETLANSNTRAVIDSTRSNSLPSWEEDFILEFAKEFDLQKHEQYEEFCADVLDLFPSVTREQIENFIGRNEPTERSQIVSVKDANESREELESGEWAGALIDYDNDMKRRWRATLAEFITKNSAPEERKNQKILCLPGVECHEIPMYLELWFIPENILWVEAGIVNGKTDPKLLKRFEESAKKYGIQYRLGKLEKVLKTEQTIFDVVNLDFLGPVSKISGEILRLLRLSKKSIIITNFQWRREQANMQVAMSKVAGRQSDYGKIHDDFSFINQGHAPLHEDVHNVSLSDARDSWAIGVYIIDNTLTPENLFPRDSFHPIFDRVSRIFSPERLHTFYNSSQVNTRDTTDKWLIEIETRVGLAKASSEWLNKIITGELQSSKLPQFPQYHEFFSQWTYILLRSLLCYANIVETHEAYSYTSETKTPMVTDCLRVHAFNEARYSEMKHTVRFLLILADVLFEHLLHAEKNEPPTLARRDKNDRQNTSLLSSDKFVLSRKWKIYAELPIKTLLLDLKSYHDYYSVRNVFATERKKISPL